jgi:hypothetical protein
MAGIHRDVGLDRRLDGDVDLGPLRSQLRIMKCQSLNFPSGGSHSGLKFDQPVIDMVGMGR